MATKIQKRRDTAANWAAVNPVLAQGEEGLELDTGQEKVGNGTTNWNNLPYKTFGITASSIGAATAAQGAKADTAVQPAGLTKTAVGLGNADNTSDANKPISTATAAALAAKADTTSVVLLSSAIPQALGTATAGTATGASRADHQHAMPNATQVGADASGTAAAAVAAHAAAADPHPDYALESDARFSDAREWSADTISQAEAEAGTATTRRAFTAARVFQAVAAWWAGSAAATALAGKVDSTDTRLSDPRTPTAHKSTHATGGADALSPADIGAATAAQGAKADTAVQPAGLTKSAVGLSNVDNTSDANKPVSTATATALAGKAATGAIGSSGLTMAAGRVLIGPETGTGAPREATLAPDLIIDGTVIRALRDILIPLSDESTALATGVRLTVPYWPKAMALTELPIWMVGTAPTGAALQLDIRVGGTSIFSTLPTIAAGSTSSVGGTPAVFSTAFVSGGQQIAAGALVTFRVLQVGSTVAGAGLKVSLATRRAS